jgi:tRNA G18 (ribose-2'-O)-methylase SpoU
VTLIPVTDPDDQRLAVYRNVPDADLAARSGLFIAEGRLVVRRLLADSAMAVRSVMVTQAAAAAFDGGLVPRRRDVPVFVVPQQTMNRVAGFNVHRGCLAIGERPDAADWRPLVVAARRLVVLEGVANADNVGAIFRNAAAFDVDAVLLGPSCADPLYRKAIRTSMGASLTLPFASMKPWPESLGDLARRGFGVVAMTPAAHAAPLQLVVAELRERPAALVVGNEGDGLTAGALTECERLARIPMPRTVDSLNVATATAIGLYAIAAQQER